MAIVKQRTAVRVEYTCAECNGTVKLTEKYYDSDEKIGKKPFPTKKYCLTCGEKKKKNEITE